MRSTSLLAMILITAVAGSARAQESLDGPEATRTSDAPVYTAGPTNGFGGTADGGGGRADRDDRPRLFHDGGMDRGAKLALSGAIVFSAIYPLTASLGWIGSWGNCFDTQYQGCENTAARALEIPVVGGFIYVAQAPAGYGADLNRAFAISSALMQTTAVGLLVGGLVTHHWKVRADKPSVAPLVTSSVVGVTGRF